MSTPREERLARNEVLFRSINERLKEMHETFHVMTEHSEFVCECGNTDCTERIMLSLPDYERLRSDSMTFAVVPGHQIEDVEDVVESREHHLIVRKHAGEASTIARVADPRS